MILIVPLPIEILTHPLDKIFDDIPGGSSDSFLPYLRDYEEREFLLENVGGNRLEFFYFSTR